MSKRAADAGKLVAVLNLIFDAAIERDQPSEEAQMMALVLFIDQRVGQEQFKAWWDAYLDSGPKKPPGAMQ